jgi:hypothetical protein
MNPPFVCTILKMPHSSTYSWLSNHTGYTVLPYSNFLGSSNYHGTLLTKACFIVCGGNKNESFRLGEAIIQILAAMGTYSPHVKYIAQIEAVVHYLTFYANCKAVAQTSVQNWNKLWRVGSVICQLHTITLEDNLHLNFLILPRQRTLLTHFPPICPCQMSLPLFPVRNTLDLLCSHLHTPCVMRRLILHCIGQACWLKLVLLYVLNGKWMIQCSLGCVFYEYCTILESIA